MTVPSRRRLATRRPIAFTPASILVPNVFGQQELRKIVVQRQQSQQVVRRMFDWIVDFVERSGYLGIALLMLLENLFPPVPSELIMPLAGYSAARGDLNLVLVLAAGTLGSVAGALFWFYVGRWLGCERLKQLARNYGRWLTVSPDDIDGATTWFRKHCGKSVFLGRLVPAVRTLISIPAGLAQMSVGRFLLYTSLGTAAWAGALAGAGYALGDQYERVSHWLNPVTNVVLAVIAVWYVYRVMTYRTEK